METNDYLNLTASGQVKLGQGVLVGMYVNSTSSGTIRFNDGTSGTPSAGVKASGVLTGSGVFTAGETITVGNKTYTMVASLTNHIANQILIGADLATSLDNIKSAVNATTGAGTVYSYGTEAHTQVTATTNTDTAQTFEAISVGTAGNSIATTTTAANASFGAANLASGVDINKTINNTITPAIGYHNLGSASFARGCYATIANTLNVTLYFKPM
jgi:hypothetical protein